MSLTTFRTTGLLVTAAAMEILTGLSIYAFPDSFPYALYAALIPWFPYLSASLVAGGIALLLMARYPLPTWTRRLITLLPAAPLLVFARHLAINGGISGMINYMGTALALLVLPWLSVTEGCQQAAAPDLLAPALGLIQAATGLAMILLPDRFNSQAFAPISGVLPVVGVIGLVGTVALLLPTTGLRLGRWPCLILRVLAALLPAVLTYTFIRTAAWNGVAGWLVWAVAALIPDSLLVSRWACTETGDHCEWNATDPWPAQTERSLELWLWMLALLVVALTALGGEAAVHSPLRANLFVLCIALYNTIAHWAFPHLGSPTGRLSAHLLFLTVATSFLLSDKGSINLAVLPVLTVVPLVEARARGTKAGGRMLAIVIATVVGAGLDAWLTGETLRLAFGNTVGLVSVLIGGGMVGVHAAGAQRSLVRELATAHQSLAERHNDLQAANATLLTQSEELTAQQEELASQHESLLQQSEELVAQRSELETSERRFRMGFDEAPIGMILGGPDLRIGQVNRAFCSMLGRPAEQLTGERWETFTHPDDRSIERTHLQQLWDGTLSTFQVEKRYCHQSGEIIWAQLNMSAVRDADGKPIQFIAHIQDITDRKRAEEQLLHLANYDSLTGLYNRRHFEEEVERQLAHSRRYGSGGALLFLDLDQFKYVNDTLGHRAGDLLLQGLAGLIRRRLRQTDTVARLGGDEFAILLPETPPDAAVGVANDLLRAIQEHVETINGHPVGITASIGIVHFPEQGASAEELLSRADLAMYNAKESGRNGTRCYTPSLGRLLEMDQKLSWENRIRMALEHDQFVLHLQPVLSLSDNRVKQYEVLLRLPNADGSIVYPGLFLPIAEQFGLVGAIDRWVIKQSIRMIARARDAGTDLRLSVNLSGKTFGDHEFPALVRRELAETGVDPGALVLEVTETAAIADIAQARRFMESLRELGCRFALDDFGSAWSSLFYLKHLPVDFLKIDGSFIEGMSRDPVDQELVKSMVEVARRLGKGTVAEFVQDEQTVALLRTYGVDYAQGYHIGRPAPAAGI